MKFSTLLYYLAVALYITTSCTPKETITIKVATTKPPNSKALKEHASSNIISKIAFGSCLPTNYRYPVLHKITKQNPDLFIFLGDNLYANTRDMEIMQEKYDKRGNQRAFKKLRKNCPVIATWDDHDYGENDAGRHYPQKENAKEIFLNFWDVPAEDMRRKREGIYTSYYYEEKGKSLQIIVLDTRTFRDNLKYYKGESYDKGKFTYQPDYVPYTTADSTLLGNEQWEWLEEQLTVPADIRIIASSTQFGISWNGYEAWANFPHEQEKMFNLIKKANANGVFFISGDVHYAELSRIDKKGLYPIYDFTSSGMSTRWGFTTPNDNRVGDAVLKRNFGVIDIDWEKEDPVIKFQVFDKTNKKRFEQSVSLSELSF